MNTVEVYADAGFGPDGGRLAAMEGVLQGEARRSSPIWRTGKWRRCGIRLGSTWRPAGCTEVGDAAGQCGGGDVAAGSRWIVADEAAQDQGSGGSGTI